MINELLVVNPTTLDINSEYDMAEHTPFPKLNYIAKETGVDLILATKSEENAKATLRMLTKLVRDILYNAVQRGTRSKLEFLIAKHEDYRKAFIDVVAGMVFATRVKGLESVLITGEMGIKDLPKLVQVKMDFLLANQYGFTLTQDQIRSDY